MILDSLWVAPIILGRRDEVAHLRVIKSTSGLRVGDDGGVIGVPRKKLMLDGMKVDSTNTAAARFKLI